MENFLRTEVNVFSFDDFSIETKRKYCALLNDPSKEIELDKLEIRLVLNIDYSTKDDNLQNIPILNLDPDKNIVLIEFRYGITTEGLKQLREDFANDNALNYSEDEYLHKWHKKYFSKGVRAIDPDNDSIEAKLESSDLSKIINFQAISAKRGVANDDKEGEKNRKVLSKLSHKYFEKLEDPGKINKLSLQKQLRETDKELTDIYGVTFRSVIKSISDFGYKQPQLKIKSVLEAVNLMRDNTSVVYSESEDELPEEYNGLGYLNLFAIIFQLHIICDDFKRIYDQNNTPPADINLLFIEEPEAHTHPQMQYIFINNIKSLLTREKGELSNLQTIVTTHSAHITSQSNFNDIKYLRREALSVEAKSLSNLHISDDSAFKFVKKYLTIHRSELFFADKIIFIEGDTERVLLPAIMKKIDLENVDEEGYIPLLSQNISVIEVGNYSQLFEEFIDFIGTKTLIITDIDSVKMVKNSDGKNVKKACSVLDTGAVSSNSSISFFVGEKDINELLNLAAEQRTFERIKDEWKQDKSGLLQITYQNKENDYHARSFEDAFFAINMEFISDNKDTFEGIKNKSKISSKYKPHFEIAEEHIKSKSTFATDILLHSQDDYSNWAVPKYIKDGLLWLSKDNQ